MCELNRNIVIFASTDAMPISSFQTSQNYLAASPTLSPRTLVPAEIPKKKTTTPTIKRKPLAEYRCCADCDHEPKGKVTHRISNLKRHRSTCPKFSPSAIHHRPHKCNHPGCPKRFTRSDNLRVHQKKMGHDPIYEMEVMSELPGSEPEVLRVRRGASQRFILPKQV